MNALGDAWRHGAAWLAVTGFVTRVTTRGSREYVPPAERVAVFDDDGTLWPERPLPIQWDFLTQCFAEETKQHPHLLRQEPWRAAAAGDLAWFADAEAFHLRGDGTRVRLVTGAAHGAFDGMDVAAYAEQAALFLPPAAHPVLHRPYLHCGYAPMRGLMRYLRSHDFSVYIATGGDREFARPLLARLFDIPPEHVIGAATGLRYLDDGARIVTGDEPALADDPADKPVRVWRALGRRPILTAGNSNGDIPLLRFTGGGGPALRLLVDHDDAEREFSYADGAEDALAHAGTEGWTVVSMREDWARVFDA